MEYTELDKKIIEDAQQEVWDFVDTVLLMKLKDREEIFGCTDFKGVIFGYSYKRAKENYDYWEKLQIKVGDEVKEKNGYRYGIVTGYLFDDNVNIVYDDGSVGHCLTNELVKTNNHFPQIKEMLKEIKEKAKK